MPWCAPEHMLPLAGFWMQQPSERCRALSSIGAYKPAPGFVPGDDAVEAVSRLFAKLEFDP